MDWENLKPHLKDFIRYYYDDLGNSTGGYLHIALDDGNLGGSDIWFCQQECEKHGDTFGMFLGRLMRHFDEEELEEMYYEDHWGLEK